VFLRKELPRPGVTATNLVHQTIKYVFYNTSNMKSQIRVSSKLLIQYKQTHNSHAEKNHRRNPISILFQLLAEYNQ
jgi:hypothetical protein